jgi:hypothetical protein
MTPAPTNRLSQVALPFCAPRVRALLLRGSLAAYGMIALAVACGSGEAPSVSAPATPSAAPPPTTTVSHPPPLPEGATIFVIVMENHDYHEVVGHSDAPYLNELIHRYGLATNYVGEHRHPSMPNYIELTSGGSWGIHDDHAPSSHPLAVDNLGSQLEAAHIPWRAYMESMGEPCRTESAGEYAVKHNPFVYYDAIRGRPDLCRAHDVDFAELSADLATAANRFVWITPNMCHDMHNCPVSEGDQWLHEHVPEILASPGFTRGGILFITWDEGEHGQDRIATVVASPRIVSPNFRSDVRHTHASLLATIEDQLGLPRLGDAVTATPLDEFFRATP